MADWPAQKGETLVVIPPGRDASETIEALRIMLQSARAASTRRLERATKANGAVARMERTFISQRLVVRRQGDYIERMKAVLEIAADVVNPDVDDETHAEALAALGTALDALNVYRRAMKQE